MICLDELIANLPVEPRGGATTIHVRHVVEDSREAGPGDLFVARAGTVTDGRRFIDDAVARGAVAVLADASAVVPLGTTHLLAADVPGIAAVLAERACGAPSGALALVGVTGTNGKTTVATLIRQLLDGAGIRCGLMGTVEVHDGASRAPASLTTPAAPVISRTLRRMVDNGCAAAVMEVSSHALDQRRTAGLAFAGGVFTNISGDHLDYHATMDAYVEAKAALFAALPRSGWAVVNVDDAAAHAMVAECPSRLVTVSLRDGAAACSARITGASVRGTDVRLAGPWGAFAVHLPLLGPHNVMNALQAAAVGAELGLDATALRVGLARAGAPPGRLELVTDPGAEFTVLVDYAHTDDALENALASIRPVMPKSGRLRVVFGCGGDRDRTKRPRMARAACRGADEVIITSDNPRTEDPQRIIEEIATGVPAERRADTMRVPDRAEAIERAVSGARPGDVILIAGKGHEDYQIIGTERRNFDDRSVARSALRRAGAAAPEPAREVAAP